MRRKNLIIAVLLSVGLHVTGALVETAAEKRGTNMQGFDAVVSWPARLCSVLMPAGHGIPQLVFPLVFSLVFYAAVFRLLIFLYELYRRKLGS